MLVWHVHFHCTDQYLPPVRSGKYDSASQGPDDITHERLFGQIDDTILLSCDLFYSILQHIISISAERMMQVLVRSDNPGIAAELVNIGVISLHSIYLNSLVSPVCKITPLSMLFSISKYRKVG